MEDLQRLEMSVTERAELLDDAKIVPALEWKQIERLACFLEAYDVPPGVTVIVEGNREQFMCVVARGSLVVLKRDDGGSEKEISRLLKGKTFGEMSLIDEEPRSATIRAVSRSRFS